MKELLLNGEKAEHIPCKLRTDFQPLFNEAAYCNMVEKAKHYIREGDIFQVVLSNRLEAEMEGSLLDAYRVLRTTNPSPYMFYFSGSDGEIVGASPETLVKLEDGYYIPSLSRNETKRQATEEADKALEAELLADEKERSEHNMLVDLGRNDIGKISQIGTVKVEKYMSIESYSHVMHIGSTVTGEIREDADALDAVDAILPAGTLSGAPKIRACEIIQELEDSKRGIYGGAIGYLALPETWIPALPSDWLIKRTERYASGPEPESWQTVFRKRNTGNAPEGKSRGTGNSKAQEGLEE